MSWYIDINNLDSFTFGGVSSTSFNFGFKADNLKPFEQDFELKPVPGRSGDLLINNNRKKNKTINIEGVVDCKEVATKVVMKKFNEWLCGEVRYKPLTFSNDYVNYEGIVVGGIDFEEVIEGFIKIKFKFSAKEVA